jgi:alkanesulfonate monooxygenase SsuD/methylene tetrahydromethanopterin reductase-like flavin-dependent oxidoreductase (luciferase family)
MNNDADVERFVRSVDKGILDVAETGGVDNAIWDYEVRLADLVEPLGFDSIWAYEHHGSPYIQHPNPLQWLSFWAGRTQRIGVGAMMVIVPWYQPVRLAEQLVLLQHMLGDRSMRIGLGRGLGAREYAGLDIPMGESRARYEEGVRIVRELIGKEAVNYQGQFFKVPDESQRAGAFSIRPRPRDARRLLDSLYGGWGSPSSAGLIADLELKPLVVPNKFFTDFVADLKVYHGRREAAGLPHVGPVVCTTIGYCGETDAECDEIFAGYRKYLKDPANGMGGHSSIEVNYEYSKNYHAQIPGYEHYTGDLLKSMGLIVDPDAAVAGDDTLDRKADGLTVATPDFHIKRLTEVAELLGASKIVIAFNGLGRYLPVEMVEKSMRLFANEVLPAIHALEVPMPAYT